MARRGKAPPATQLHDGSVLVAAVVTSFHPAIAARLLDGARERLVECGLVEPLEVLAVPGAFEAPLACQAAARSGRFDALVVLGAVVRGETPNFGYVSETAVSGIARVSLEHHIPIGFGLLTVDTVDQAEARAGGAVGNAGVDAVDAVVAMLNLTGSLQPSLEGQGSVVGLSNAE